MKTNEHARFGSAAFATRADYREAGLYRSTNKKALLGFDRRKPLYFGGPGGITTVAGARSGKLTTSQAFTQMSFGYQGNILSTDPKGELAATFQNQAFTGKHVVTWNPLGLHGLPRHSIDLFDYIDLGSAAVFSDIQSTCEVFSPLSGSAQSEFFELRARDWNGGIGLHCTEVFGRLTISDWVTAVGLLLSGGEEWEEFADSMSESRFEWVRRAEHEIREGRESESGGFRGILGEIAKSFRAFVDPALLDSLSPPFAFSYADLLSETDRFNVYLIVPPEQLGVWAVPMKLHLNAAMIHKARAPQAPGQLWMLDELAQMGANPTVVRAYTYGAGIGVKPWGILQSVDQLNALGKDAKTIILSSSQTQQWFGVRDKNTAEFLSAMMGDETLSFDDTALQLAAEQRRAEAVQALISGEDPVKAAIALRGQSALARNRSQMRRRLMTPDEILNMPKDRQLIFTDEIDKPVYCERRAYYDLHWTAGRYHPNPYHGAQDRVRIKKRSFGFSTRRVLTKKPPGRLAHLRQYQNRSLSYIEGYEP